MKNRSLTLLALLAANDRLGQTAVHRTTLVKQAFLAETIRPLYRIWLQTFQFVRYYYGPYSDDVFYRLDTLIFNGLVVVITGERRAGQFEARYKISEAGHNLLNLIDAPDIIELATDLIWALQALGVEKASTICKLVYQEAEFDRIFTQHNSSPSRHSKSFNTSLERIGAIASRCPLARWFDYSFNFLQCRCRMLTRKKELQHECPPHQFSNAGKS